MRLKRTNKRWGRCPYFDWTDHHKGPGVVSTEYPFIGERLRQYCDAIPSGVRKFFGVLLHQYYVNDRAEAYRVIQEALLILRLQERG